MTVCFDMTDPCMMCPFRTDRPHYMSSQKANDFAVRILTGETFYCHHASSNERQQQCVGTTILLEKLHRPNTAMGIGEAIDPSVLGHYDYRRPNMSAPVFNTFGQWVEAIEAEEATWMEEEDEWESYLNKYRQRRLTPAQRREAEKTIPDPPVAHRVG